MSSLATALPIITLPAGAALSQGQHVKVSSGTVVAAGTSGTDVGLGIILEDVASGDAASIALLGSGSIVFVEASAAIALGAKVMPATTGRVATATSTNSCIGVALQAATAAGHLIKVCLGNPSVTV